MSAANLSPGSHFECQQEFFFGKSKEIHLLMKEMSKKCEVLYDACVKWCNTEYAERKNRKRPEKEQLDFLRSFCDAEYISFLSLLSRKCPRRCPIDQRTAYYN
jgi:hypothetical protein